MSIHSEGISTAVAKLAPPLTVGGLTLFGIPLNEVVLALTGLYAVLQIGFLLHDRVVKPCKEKRSGRERKRTKQDT